MPLCKIVNALPFGVPGDREMHYGFQGEVCADRTVTVEVPEELLAGELAAGRVTLIEAPSKKKKGE